MPENRLAPPEEDGRTFMPNQRRDEEQVVRVRGALERPSRPRAAGGVC